jgi:hypothetical protein
MTYWVLAYKSSYSLEKRAEQILPGSERNGGEWGLGGEMAQKIYAHVNK